MLQSEIQREHIRHHKRFRKKVSGTMKDPNRYDDMLNLPHHQSKTHPKMTRYNRAAQFSPFAALTGYEDTIAETARLTDCRLELDENAKAILDTKFLMIIDRLNDHQELEFTYYVPDRLKEGGSYQTVSGVVKKISITERILILYAANGISDGPAIQIDQIVDIHGAMFGSM